jgi:hypothetical protein
MNPNREGGMTRFFSALLLLFWMSPNFGAATPSQVSVAHNGWTIVADGERGVVSISYDGLGIVMKDLQLQLRGDDGLTLLKDWSVEKQGDRQLTIRTSQPPTAWSFDLGPNTLKISSTATNAVVTAKVPAAADRIVARLLDPEGVPVDWEGTAEVQHTYGGKKTWNQSYLPQRNPECMYLAFGQVSGSNLHSLFDRKTDTAMTFPEHALLQRDPQDSDLLDATIPVPGNALVRIIPDYFTRTLGVPYYIPYDDSYFSKAPIVWCSWTSYYGEVREEDIVRNADWLAENLKPYGFGYVQLDDGYDRGERGKHYWIENWDETKFSHGPQWLTNYIKSKGLRPGLWLVPNAYAGAVEKHPDWYLYDKQGKVILDYRTPTLDSTNPQVLDFLKKEFTTLRDWGFEYYKFDGEHAVPKYAPTVDLNRLYDKTIDPLVAYRNRLKLIRETVGPKTFIEGCPAGTPLNGIGYFNSYFNGEDVYNNWPGMYALFSSINANAFLNHLVVYLMPGEGIEVGPPMSAEEASKRRYPSVIRTARTREEPLTGFGTTMPEARTLVTYVALTGVVYPLASVMPELPEERVQLLKKTMPTLPILPVDLFSRGTDMRWDRFKDVRPDDYIHNYPEILDLKVNAKSGVYDVVGLTNWRGVTARRELSFAKKLGLRTDSSYVVFDFWAQKPLGIFKGQMDVEIEPHDTRVLLIHPLLNHPQLIGTSRHISGAVSIQSLIWDSSRNTLSGSSQTVPGDDYTLWVQVPKGVAVSAVRAVTSGNREVPAHHEMAGNSLALSFAGQADPVNWEIEFAPRASR